MAVGYEQLLSFNKGMISKLGTARLDIKRVALSAEIQTNWMPRVLGSMMLRPGTQFIGTSQNSLKPIYIPFVFNNEETAILEVTSAGMRIRIDEQIVVVGAVGTAVTNGNFNGNINSWTDASQSGGSITYVANNKMGITGTGQNYGIGKQHVTVAPGDQGQEHNLRFTVGTGTITIRVGSTDGGDDYIPQTDLRQGTYSINFTPGADVYIRLMSLTIYQSQIDSVNFDVAGPKVLPTPWAAGDLQFVRWDQSADVLFVACNNYQQVRISRRTPDSRSWGVDIYQPPDGPFRLENVGPVTLAPSALSGDITITASQSLFYPTQVNALFKITSDGQFVGANLAGNAQFTNNIQVTGVGSAQRTFGISITGTWAGTLTLQQSVGAPGAWVDVEGFTGNTSTSFSDGLDNQIIFYQIGFKAGSYVSGTASVSITYSNGSITGIARVVAYNSPTQVTAQVLQEFGSASASVNWVEGSWSDYRGWPSSVALFEGRLGWAGKGNIWGSVSDAYESFDETVEGDSGPLEETIGSGPVDIITWMLPLLRLLLGGQAAEHSVRSSAIDTPLTPSNFSIKAPSARGSAPVAALKMDMGGFFIDKSGTRLYELNIENAYYSYDYSSVDKTQYIPEIGATGLVRLGLQRTIDTRIHAIRADGDVGILVYDDLESVQAWIQYHTEGLVHDVIVMPNPGQTEDKIYYSVQRTINGQTAYYLERWALENECQGGTLNKQVDCHIVYSGAPTNTISAPHLPNTTLKVWGDGKDQGAVTTDGSGNASLPNALTVSNYVAGLGYIAQFKSTKLSDSKPDGAPSLTQLSAIDHMSLVMQNTHAQGLQYGTSFDDLQDLPGIEEGAPVDPDFIWPEYDQPAFEMIDSWSSDTRICLQAASPRPCTVKAMVIKQSEGRTR